MRQGCPRVRCMTVCAYACVIIVTIGQGAACTAIRASFVPFIFTVVFTCVCVCMCTRLSALSHDQTVGTLLGCAEVRCANSSCCVCAGARAVQLRHCPLDVCALARLRTMPCSPPTKRPPWSVKRRWLRWVLVSSPSHRCRPPPCHRHHAANSCRHHAPCRRRSSYTAACSSVWTASRSTCA